MGDVWFWSKYNQIRSLKGSCLIQLGMVYKQPYDSYNAKTEEEIRRLQGKIDAIENVLELLPKSVLVGQNKYKPIEEEYITARDAFHNKTKEMDSSYRYEYYNMVGKCLGILKKIENIDIKAEKIEMFEIDYFDFNCKVNEFYSLFDYDIAEDMESHNDTAHRFMDIEGTPPRDYDKSKLEKFRKGEHCTHMARTLLEDMCCNGAISSGNYFIWVSW